MKQITYPNVGIDIQPQPDGKTVVLVIQVIHSHPLGNQQIVDETLLFPMPIAMAETIGKKLCAPRVVVAPANGKIAA